MGSIFAYFNKSGDHSHYEVVREALNKMHHWGPDYSDTWCNDVLGLGCNGLYTSSLSDVDKMPYYHEPSGCCIVADVRIDYKEELATELDIEPDVVHEMSDNQLIIFSYLKWKEQCTKHLYGDFSFIIWNEETSEIFCTRDHFGTRPLYYINSEKFIAFSNDLKGFTAIPLFKLQVKDLSLIEAMCSIIPNKDVTAFNEVLCLKPASNLLVSPDASIQITSYWDLKVNPAYIALTEEEAIKGIKKRFVDAVKQRAGSVGPIGVELSGGLDSSSVVSCLSNFRNSYKDVLAFSHVMPEKGFTHSDLYKDELHFSKQITAITGIVQHYLLREDGKKGSYSALIELLIQRLVPEVQFFATFSDLLLEKAKQSGVSVLLSGYGGDEGVTNSGMAVLSEFVHHRDYKKLKQALKDSVRRSGGNYYKKLLKQYLLVVAPWIFKLMRKNWRKLRYNSFFVEKSLLKKYFMKKRFFDYVSFRNIPDVRIRQYDRIMHPHVPDRLETSYTAAQTKRIEYRYPFLDVKLLEFYYSVQSEFKYKDGIGRYLFREAMKGILPEEIRMRDDKTYITIPNIYSRLIQDESKYREIIIEGKKNNRFHYADYKKLLQMLNSFRDKKNFERNEIGITPFLSTISVLILQKWQREGKIDIGIKC